MEILDKEVCGRIKVSYLKSASRIIFLDYDGTLVPFANQPEMALPGEDVLQLLEDLASIKRNTVVIISGRDRYFLDKVFGNMNLTLVAEHGFYVRKPGEGWEAESLLDNNWKAGVREVFIRYRKLFPGSMIEEKDSAMAWHFRNCEIVPTNEKLEILKVLLNDVINGYPVELLEGNKVVEIKKQSITKGSAATKLIKENIHEFIIAIGDDLTDEDLFIALPKEASTIKVGNGTSVAKYFCLQLENIKLLLACLLKPNIDNLFSTT